MDFMFLSREVITSKNLILLRLLSVFGALIAKWLFMATSPPTLGECGSFDGY